MGCTTLDVIVQLLTSTKSLIINDFSQIKSIIIIIINKTFTTVENSVCLTAANQIFVSINAINWYIKSYQNVRV